LQPTPVWPGLAQEQTNIMRLSLFLIAATGLGCCTAVAPLCAQQKTVAAHRTVLELYTSQGCSSCPAADALLLQYAHRPDILALTLPVDYWDYLGWKDTLASRKFSDRQRAYAKSLGHGTIFTPQIVVDGRTDAVGSNRADIDKAVDQAERATAKTRVAIEIRPDSGFLVISAAGHPQGSAEKPATLWLATLSKHVEVPIQRGENRGRTGVYTNVVRELRPLGTWDGSPMTVRIADPKLEHTDVQGCAVLLQRNTTGPILGAALLAQD
jgi:hypothetical protein